MKSDNIPVYDGYIKTISGRSFYLDVDTISCIDVKDIAHALANVARFNGHTSRHYSVAEHSVLVLQILRQWNCLNFKSLMTGLLHDATEAYLPDLPTPFKAYMPEYQQKEVALWGRIAKRFDLWENPNDVPHQEISEVVMGIVTAENLSRSLIKHADRTALFIEAQLLQPHGQSDLWPEHEFYGMLARSFMEDRHIDCQWSLKSKVCGPFHPRLAFLRQYSILKAGRELSGE
jgi:5'-deoxynucleotidase YfbR-like HD superfamily hydrolase